MRLRKRRMVEGGESSTGIDLAPMLDFVINLLIFFIITAVFVKESGLVVQRPTEFEAEETDTESINIVITDTGDVSVDGRLIDVRSVRANVERMSAIDSQAGVLVIASERAPTGVVVEVVDQVHLGGVYNVTFATN